MKNKTYIVKAVSSPQPFVAEMSVVIAESPERAELISSVGRWSDVNDAVVQEVYVQEIVLDKEMELMFSSGMDTCFPWED